MTVETTSTYAGPYATDGAATAFPFTFKSLSASEVRVEIAGTVVDPSLFAVQLAAQGGTVVFSTAPAAGSDLFVISDPDFRQGISFSNQAAFLPASHNEANDRAAVRDQVLDEGLRRAIQLPLGEEAPVLPSAADRAGGNKILAPDPVTGAITVLDGSAFTGNTGPADNTYTSYTAMQESDPTRASARLVGDTDVPPHADGPYNNPTQTVNGWVPQGAAGVVAIASGQGAVVEDVNKVLGRNLDAIKYQATATGRTSDLTPIRNLVKAVRKAMSDGSRTLAGDVKLPAGRYLLNGNLNAAFDGPVTGLTIAGAGAGSTEIILATTDAYLSAPASRDLTFRDLSIRSIDPTIDTDIYTPGQPYGVALLQSAFKIAHSFGLDVATLRTWRFINVTFSGLYRCLEVTGASMCSEFSFINCSFLQC